jgi:ribosomal protein S18 acetylase RimI-like enzyme
MKFSEKKPVLVTFCLMQTYLLSKDYGFLFLVFASAVFYFLLFLFVYKNQTDVITFRTDMHNIKQHYGKRCFVAEVKKGDKIEVLGMVAYEDTESTAKNEYLKKLTFDGKPLPKRLIQLESLSVDKEVRKCGIGRALMAKIHKIAEKEKAAIIATNPESHHAAHALYRKLGEF